MPGSILIVASLDTKWPEVTYLKELIEQKGQRTSLLDMSMRSQSPIPAEITCEAVARAAGANIEEIINSDRPRDESTAIMIKGAIIKTLEMYRAGQLLGIVGVGGVTNTAFTTDIMKVLPFGVPKLMVSSGAAMPRYAGGFFGSSDITMMSSVVDMAGLHKLSKNVLKRAAGAICGMVESGTGSVIDSLKQSNGHLVALTEFQYSGMCCELVSKYLEGKGYTVIPCHADGVGDRAMEELLEQGIFNAVVDIVPAGLSEELFGGNRAAGTARLEMAVKRGLPLVVTPCGFEMISCGPIQRKDSGDPLWISKDIASRNYYVQDAYRVQARINADELRLIARAVSEKLNRAKGPVRFLIPQKGWSSLSILGQTLYDADADSAFVEELRECLKPEIIVREVPLCLNCEEFALTVVESLEEMIGSNNSGGQI
ncbi:Tm-1-like ATP-binding domain-containing protein [Chloroflexota bacterium]